MESINPVIKTPEKATFSFYLAPATQVRYYKEATLLDIYRCLTDPKVAKLQTDTLRLLTDKDQRANYKRNFFNYSTFSGKFQTNRKNDALIEHSGLMCHDFDHLDNLQEVKRWLLMDSHFETLLLFTSPSGNGLKWVIPIDLSKATHEQWFLGVSNYLRQTYGLVSDPACRNVARACFIPYDPDAYIAPRLLPELQNYPELINFATQTGATNVELIKNINNYE